MSSLFITPSLRDQRQVESWPLSPAFAKAGVLTERIYRAMASVRASKYPTGAAIVK
jgi:hypothetical protein